MPSKIKSALRFISLLPFLIVLPLVWGVTCFVEFSFPGDEYAMWAMASMPGAWILFLLENINVVHGNSFMIVVFAGMAVMAAVGFAMDRLRVLKWAWLIFYLVLAG